jgi:hypothetical protein
MDAQRRLRQHHVVAPSEAYVSGMPFTPNDIKLNRYYDKYMDKSSYPSTLGISKVKVDVPSKILDVSKNLTAQSMHDCVVNNGLKRHWLWTSNPRWQQFICLFWRAQQVPIQYVCTFTIRPHQTHRFT